MTSVPTANILQLVNLIIFNLRLDNLKVFEYAVHQNDKHFSELKTAVTDGALFRQVKLIRSGHAYMIILLHQLSALVTILNLTDFSPGMY